MADPVQRVICGDLHFDFSGLMADEMADVKGQTGIPNRRKFYEAVRNEDPDAVIAAFTLAERRRGSSPRWGDVKVTLDDLRWGWFIEDRQVEPMVETDADGSPLLVKHDNDRPVRDDKGAFVLDPKGGLVPLANADGSTRWRYADSGEEVPPTQAGTTSGSSVSPATDDVPEPSDFDSGIPTTVGT